MNSDYIQTLADDTIKTVDCCFFDKYGHPSSGKTYTYKTRLDLEIGDVVVVWVQGQTFKTVEVVAIHDEPNIDCNSTKTYQWVLQKVEKDLYEKAAQVDRNFYRQLKAKERQVHKLQAKVMVKQLLGDDMDISNMLEEAAKDISEEFGLSD